MTLRSNKNAAFAFSALAIGMATMTVPAYAAQMQGISATQTSASVTQLRVAFDGQPSMPVAYQQVGSNQLVLDFNQTSMGAVPRSTAVNTGVVNNVTALSNGSVVRLMVDLKNAANYSSRIEGNQLVLDIVDLGVSTPMAPATAPQTMHVQVNPLLVPSNAQNNRGSFDGVSAVKYSASKAGGGDVAIALTNEVVPVDVQRQGNKIVVRTTGATIPRHLLQRINVGGLVTSIDSNNQGKNGVITINMSADYEYQAYQAGTSLNISVRPAKPLREPTLEEKVYKGEPLSMEFENVPVRTVLDVLARFTNINIVAGDDVQGDMTLRVINVPWDQVLDIILKSKDLGKRENGNVIIVGKAAALAEQEKRDLKEQEEAKALAPLRTEYIRLNYATAENMFKLISEAKNSNNGNNQNSSLLSDRGSVSMDGRTNTIVVKDTSESINNIREMIDKLDIPVRQVMIEARIVTARDTFAKELGVTWGVAMNRGDLQSAGRRQGLWDMRAGGNPTSAGRYGRLGGTTFQNSSLAVDLGNTGATAGSLAFGLLSMSDMVLDLELSAMQADNRGEVISSPKVLTADKQKAKILSGQKIPYETSAANGATTISFVDAALVLEATPNITPDGKIGLQLNVQNGSPVTASNGMIAIQEDSIDTNVVLEDGQTVVLGGVFRNTTGNTVTKVPFLGDLPYVGRLFKNEKRENNKEELLIFVTPKLVQDGVSRIN